MKINKALEGISRIFLDPAWLQVAGCIAGRNGNII
jgi:hypothetical protein